MAFDIEPYKRRVELLRGDVLISAAASIGAAAVTTYAVSRTARAFKNGNHGDAFLLSTATSLGVANVIGCGSDAVNSYREAKSVNDFVTNNTSLNAVSS